MHTENEVYSKAPLALVTAQLSYAHEPRLNTPDVRDAVAEGLRKTLPVLEVEQFEEEGEVVRQLRATNEKRSITVVVTSQALTVDAIEYTHFAAFSELLSACFGALEAVIGSVYVERVGLRYIDEVRPPEVTSTQDWAEWIAPELIAPIGLLANRSVGGLRGSTVYEIADRTLMVFQWGEFVGRSVVAQTPVRDLPEVSRFFVLDADVFWAPKSPIAVAPTEMVERFSELHTPASEVFQSALTDRTRSMFRGETNE